MTKPGFSLLGSFYVVIYFVTDACLLCCVCFISSVLSQEIGWEEHVQNNVFCVGWDVKLWRNQCEEHYHCWLEFTFHHYTERCLFDGCYY